MPGFKDRRRWAFQYDPVKNHFDPPGLIPRGEMFIKQGGWNVEAEDSKRNLKPIPIGAKVDIVMSHGPPYSHLDPVPVEGAKNEGCPHLLVAVERANPQLHAFGRTLEVSRTHPTARVRCPDPFPRGGAPRS
jgi:hypothetical protein